MDLGLVPVHSFGACLRNQNVTERIAVKSDLFRKYKFCIAMENSIEGAARRRCEMLLANRNIMTSVGQHMRAGEPRDSAPIARRCMVTQWALQRMLRCRMLRCARCVCSGLRDGEDLRLCATS